MHTVGIHALGRAAAVVLISLLAPTAASASHNEDIHTPNLRVVAHDEFPYGTDLDFKGNLLVGGAGDWDDSYPTGIRTWNIAKPDRPRQLASGNCDGWHSDVAWVGSYIVQSNDSASDNDTCDPGMGEEGVRVWDASNASSPRSVGFAETIHGSHNLTAVGDTGLVYVSSYNLTNPSDVDGVSIVDVAANPTDPPVKFLEFPDADNSPEYEDMRNDSGDVPDSMGCHDVGINLERDLAYCAAITETMIWDISDPRDPVIITIIRNPLINIHHGARDNAEGDVLVLNDEWAGASGANTGCLAPNAPTGALWFYDISDPRAPTLKNYWSAPAPAPTDDFCTTHFFGTFPDRDWLVTSYYDHGIYVVDFTDPAAPTTIAEYDPGGANEASANFWSAYPYKGRLFASSFAPAAIESHNPDNHYGGLWVFELDGYSSGKRSRSR